jgi:hypothetical protein
MSKVRKQKKEPNVKSQYNNQEYPIFCFKYFQDISIKKSKDTNLFLSFCNRLKKLAELGWKEIEKSPRHSYGTENIPIKQLHCCEKIRKVVDIITEDVKDLVVFRYTGNNLPFLGLRNGNIFHIILIEVKFGDIYDHD